MFNKKFWAMGATSIAMAGMIFVSCTKEAKSGPNYVFKPATSTGVVAKLNGKEISESELVKGIETEIYEAELKVYELKFEKLKALVLEKLMDSDPNKKGLSNDEFLDKHIATTIKITDQDIESFVAERKIPKEHVNDQLKDRVRKYLAVEKKKIAVDIWVNKKLSNSPVEVFLKKPSRPVFDVKVGDSPFKGGSDAKVTIVEYTDFQCPFCAKGSAVMKDLYKKYGNKIKIVYKNFPLPFHKQAKGAAMNALCVQEQNNDAFWKLHDQLFENQNTLGDEDIAAKVKKLSGIDFKKFTDCVKANKFSRRIENDIEEGKKIGVKSTPTFFVNGKMVNGAHPVEVFSEIIDEDLSRNL